MQKLFKGSIKKYLLILLIVAFFDLILISFFSYNQLRGLYNVSKYGQTLNELETGFLLTGKAQQEFMLKYKEYPDFFKTGENVFIDNFDVSMEKNLDLIAILKEDKISSRLELKSHYDNVKESFLKYRNLFDQYSIKTKQFGSSDFGLVEKLDQSLKLVLELNLDQKINESVLMIQQKQTEFLRKPSIETYNQTIDKYRETVSLVDILLFDLNSKIKITSYLSDYANYLNLLKNLGNELGIDSDHGLKGELNRQLERIYPTIELIREDISKYKQKLYNRTLLITLLVLVISMVLVFIAVRLLGNEFNVFLKRIKVWLEQLSKGEIPDDITLSEDQNELSDINNNLFTLVNDLQGKTEFAEKIGSNDYSAEYKPSGEKDILGLALIEMRDNLNAAKEEEIKRNIEAEQRKWTNEGLNKFSDLLRKSYDDIEELDYKIISELTRYVRGSQGAIFIYNDPENKANEKMLELKAAFAYDRRKFLDKKVYPGEGLVGTVAIEGETIYLRELPSDYVVIGSGLGESEPNSLLIVPLKLNDDVFGVVEIASFDDIASFEVQFIERVGEIIASSIQSIRISGRTQKLLEQSRRQADEMSAQEEEMRQNLEELQATQEERARREAEISGILEAIDVTMLMMELNAEINIIEANEKFLKILGLEYSDVKNRHYFELVEPIKSPEEINSFIELMTNGQTLEEIIQIQTQSGFAWLNMSFTPIFDNNDELNKILILALDVTETQKQKEELLEQAEEMTAQEEEMLQNFEALHNSQDEMAKKQVELEEFNLKLKNNENILKKALEQAKEKEGQFKASQKELETKISELVKTQTELNKSEQENMAQLAAINKTSIMLELSGTGSILFPNENFCKELKYSPSELIGKNHSILMPIKIKQSKEYKELWEFLAKGNIQTGECALIAKDNNIVEIFGTYVPIIKADKTERILFIGTKLKQTEDSEALNQLKKKEKELKQKASILELQLKSTKDSMSKKIKYLEEEIKKLKSNKE